MLERQLLLHSRGGDADIGTKRHDPLDVTTLSPDARRYVDLDLPPLCRRYADLPLSPHRWFVELLAGRNEKRVHKRSHGLVPFQELAKIVARNYKEADQETKEFVNDVAERLASHCSLLEAAEWKETKTLDTGKEFRANATKGNAIDGDVKSITKMSSVQSFDSPPFSYDTELKRLQKNLELAMSTRIETERRISILTAQMELFCQQRQQEHHQHSLPPQQQQVRLHHRFRQVGELNRRCFSRLHQQYVTSSDRSDKKNMLPPPKKRFRSSNSDDIVIEATTAADEGRVDHPASLSSGIKDQPLNRRIRRADLVRASLPSAAQRGIFW